jgi:hypothetical protein
MYRYWMFHIQLKMIHPINQEYLYEVIVLTFITELIKGSYYGIINEGSSFVLKI